MRPFVVLVCVAWSSCEAALAGSAGSEVDGEARRSEVEVEVRLDRDSVEFGCPFAFTVQRRWPADWSDDGLEDAALSALEVSLVTVDRDEQAGFLVERRRYEGFAFSLENLTVPALSARAHSLEGVAEGFSLPRVLEVRPSVDREHPGEMELPADLFAAPPTPILTPLRWGVLAVFAALAATLLGRRRRSAATSTEDRQVSALARARDRGVRLEALRRSSRGTAKADRAIGEALGELLREAVADRWSMDVRGSSTEQILDSLGESPEGAVVREHLRALLEHCDALKFAGRSASAIERSSLLEDGARFLEDCASAPR